MATATAGELVQANRSHHIAIDWTPAGRGITKEELHPIVTAEWLGQELRVQLRADRYLASDGMTDWRVYVYEARRPPADGEYSGEAVALSDVALPKIAAVVKPLVLEWLESDEYPRARELAVAHAIRRELRENATSSAGLEAVRELLDRYGAELEDGYAIELARLLALAQELADGLERPLAD